MKTLLLCAIAAASIAAGCAPTQSSTDENTQRVPRDYPTGSNIPRKSNEGVRVYDREAAERARDQAVQMPRPGSGSP